MLDNGWFAPFGVDPADTTFALLLLPVKVEMFQVCPVPEEPWLKEFVITLLYTSPMIGLQPVAVSVWAFDVIEQKPVIRNDNR